MCINESTVWRIYLWLWRWCGTCCRGESFTFVRNRSNILEVLGISRITVSNERDFHYLWKLPKYSDAFCTNMRGAKWWPNDGSWRNCKVSRRVGGVLYSCPACILTVAAHSVCSTGSRPCTDARMNLRWFRKYTFHASCISMLNSLKLFPLSWINTF